MSTCVDMFISVDSSGGIILVILKKVNCKDVALLKRVCVCVGGGGGGGICFLRFFCLQFVA